MWLVPEAEVTVLCSPDDGCDGHPKYVESDFAVNKYLHTVASCWILLIQSYDTRNHEYKYKMYNCKKVWLGNGLNISYTSCKKWLVHG